MSFRIFIQAIFLLAIVNVEICKAVNLIKSHQHLSANDDEYV